MLAVATCLPNTLRGYYAYYKTSCIKVIEHKLSLNNAGVFI